MANPTRRTLLVGVVVSLAIIQITFEDVLVFVAATGQATPGSPRVFIGISLVLAVVLIVLTVGVGILTDDTLR